MQVTDEITQAVEKWKTDGGKINRLRVETGVTYQTVDRVCNGTCTLSTAELVLNYMGYRLTIEALKC